MYRTTNIATRGIYLFKPILYMIYYHIIGHEKIIYEFLFKKINA